MITVITPTYNRAYILENLWNSLKKQSIKEFEWLIIDDGSIDNTKELVSSWLNEFDDCGFEVRYFYKENGGKHRALNYGIPLAKTEYIFIVDSDDILTHDAIEYVTKWIQSIDRNKKIAGVAGLRGYPDGKRIGDFPKKVEWLDVKNSHRYTHHLDGDKAEIYKKELLLNHPFPEFEGEKFIGEGAVWNLLSLEGYKVRWFNKVIYVGNYLDDGLTNNYRELLKKNFKGYTNNTKLNFKTIVFPYNFQAVSLYIDVAYELGYDDKWIKKELDINWFLFELCKIFRTVRRIR